MTVQVLEYSVYNTAGNLTLRDTVEVYGTLETAQSAMRTESDSKERLRVNPQFVCREDRITVLRHSAGSEVWRIEPFEVK